MVRSAWLAARLYLMRRRQFDNLALRRFFAIQYDIVVGLYSYGCFDRWRMPGPMRVGRYCSIAATTRVAPRNHPMAALTTHPLLYERQFGLVEADLPPAEPLVIEDDVWIGHNTMILPGCKRVGRGAVIGAGSVVTRDVEPYAVMAGNPARKLRDRFPPELVSAIEESRWWDMDIEALRIIYKQTPDVLLHPSPATVAAWTRGAAS